MTMPVQWVLRVEKELTDVIDKIADNYHLNRSDIVRSVIPDVDFLSVLADNPIDIDRPEKLLPMLLDGGLRWFMASHPAWPLCADDLSVAPGLPLFELFRDFCKAANCLNIKEGYSFEAISPKDKQTKYKLIRPAQTQPIAPVDVVDEVTREMLAMAKKMPPVTNEQLLKRFGRIVLPLKDYDTSQRQTLRECGMNEKQIDEFMRNLKKRIESAQRQALRGKPVLLDAYEFELKDYRECGMNEKQIDEFTKKPKKRIESKK
jgi:hypothetical protein